MTFPRQVPNIPRRSETHELREDVVFAEAGGVPLRFDHYRPLKVSGAAPVVVVVHGGAWMTGDPSQAAGNALHLARRGIATVSVSYRLAPAHRLISDVALYAAPCARRSHAKRVAFNKKLRISCDRQAVARRPNGTRRGCRRSRLPQ